MYTTIFVEDGRLGGEYLINVDQIAAIHLQDGEVYLTNGLKLEVRAKDVAKISHILGNSGQLIKIGE